MGKDDLSIATRSGDLCAVTGPGQLEYTTRGWLLQGVGPLEKKNSIVLATFSLLFFLVVDFFVINYKVLMLTMNREKMLISVSHKS